MRFIVDNPHLFHLGRVVFYTALGILPASALLMGTYEIVLGDPIVADAWVRARHVFACTAAVSAGFGGAYWYGWTQGEEETDFHPVLMGIVAAGWMPFAFAIILSAMYLPREYREFLAEPILDFAWPGTLLLWPVVIIVVGFARFRVPDVRTKDRTFWITSAVLLILALLVAPGDDDFPTEADFEARQNWAVSHLGRHYEDIETFMTGLDLRPAYGNAVRFAPNGDKLMVHQNTWEDTLTFSLDARGDQGSGRCVVILRRHHRLDDRRKPIVSPTWAAHCTDQSSDWRWLYDEAGALVARQSRTAKLPPRFPEKDEAASADAGPRSGSATSNDDRPFH